MNWLLLLLIVVLLVLAACAWLYLLGVSLDAIELRRLKREIRKRERKIRIRDPIE